MNFYSLKLPRKCCSLSHFFLTWKGPHLNKLLGNGSHLVLTIAHPNFFALHFSWRIRAPKKILSFSFLPSPLSITHSQSIYTYSLLYDLIKISLEGEMGWSEGYLWRYQETKAVYQLFTTFITWFRGSGSTVLVVVRVKLFFLHIEQRQGR